MLLDEFLFMNFYLAFTLRIPKTNMRKMQDWSPVPDVYGVLLFFIEFNS